MLIEARRAARNERAQRARGGVEPPGDVYRLMRVAYPGAFLAMLVEGALRGGPPPALFVAGAIVFAAAKALKWWAILTLGPLLDLPRHRGARRAAASRRGPYRLLRHPNYVGVVGELVGVGADDRRAVSGPLRGRRVCALLVKRIAVENARSCAEPAAHDRAGV